MRIIFIGAVEFSFETLKATIKAGGNVVGVITLESSSFSADFFDLSKFSKKKNIPYIYAKDINSDETKKWIKKMRPDIAFCFGWSRLIKKEVLKIPKKGIVGYHPAMLPKNRGRHPLIWALALGIKTTGSTFFFMNNNADSGDILSQVSLNIKDDENARSLYDKITRIAIRQITNFIPKLKNNTYIRSQQNENLATSWRKRSGLDGLIDWRMSATSIYNLVRSLSKPYVGAEFKLNNITYKVWKCELLDGIYKNAEPGKIVEIYDDQPIIKCGEGIIKLTEIVPNKIYKKGEYL